jgi:hypothetical protein
MIKIVSFQCVTYFDQSETQVMIVYALGEDGVLRVHTGKQWVAFPVQEDNPPTP